MPNPILLVYCAALSALLVYANRSLGGAPVRTYQRCGGIEAAMPENPDAPVLARRAARIAFGLVMIVGANVLGARALGDWSFLGKTPPFEAWQIIFGAWMAAFAAGELTRWVVTICARGPSGERWLAASLVVPGIGLALTVPITLHMPIALGIGGSDAFDAWCRLSVPITLFPHVMLAVLTAVRGSQLARGREAISPATIFNITVIASCVPAILFVLPPFIVALTGVPILGMLRAMESVARRERDTISALPHAIAIKA
jgi:hypothetical protein